MSSATTDVVSRRLVDRDGTLAYLEGILARVDRENPDPTAVEELRTALRTAPALSRILCDFAGINNEKVIESLVSGPVGRESLTAQVEAMRDGLGYKTSPDLERGLIEHVVLCWLRVQKAEMVYSQAQTVEMTLSKADWHERRLTAAHGRYMRACDSLARVRRMGRPSAFQINVGEQQVNVAG